MRWIAGALAAIVLGLVAPPAAFAHDDVVDTSPSNGGQVTQVPDEVRVEFAEPPTSGSGSITGPAGQALRGGEVKVVGTELVIPMGPPAGLGTYDVEFRVGSTDGHPIAETLSFEVIRRPTSRTTPEATSSEAGGNVAAGAESPVPEGGGLPTWMWVGLAGGIGVPAIGLLLTRAVARARAAR